MRSTRKVPSARRRASKGSRANSPSGARNSRVVFSGSALVSGSQSSSRRRRSAASAARAAVAVLRGGELAGSLQEQVGQFLAQRAETAEAVEGVGIVSQQQRLAAGGQGGGAGPLHVQHGAQHPHGARVVRSPGGRRL